MQALQLIWILLPMILLLGNAVFLLYFSTSGRWADFLFLWPFEIILLGLTIYYTVKLGTQQSAEETRTLSIQLPPRVGRIAMSWFMLVGGLGVLLGWLGAAFSFGSAVILGLGLALLCAAAWIVSQRVTNAFLTAKE